MNEEQTEIKEEVCAEEGGCKAQDEIPSETKKQISNKTGFVRGVLTGCLIMSVVFLIIVLGYNIRLRSQAKKAASLLDMNSIVKLNTLSYLLDEYYYEDVSVEDERNGMFKGLIRSTGDPYGDYYTEEDLLKFQQDYDGVFGGIGATVTYDSTAGYCYVVEVVPDSPAAKADVRPGDYFMTVAGVNAHEKSSSELVEIIRGDVGTDVDISFMRDGKQIDLTLTRDLIETLQVTYEKVEDEDIAYISVSGFDAVTPKQFKDALNEAESDGVKGVIFDLRGNPGGNVAAVVEMLGELCPKGIVVYTEDKHGNRQDFLSEGNNTYNYPTVVLVDRSSASCSEIFAGALKDLNIATLMGTKTYGKGIVQNVKPLNDGTAVKLTVAKYYTPNGTNFHGVGIEPDEKVEFDGAAYLKDGTDNQREAAIEFIKKQIDK